MAENKMKEVAKLLGVELEEEFRIDFFDVKYKLTKNGLMYWRNSNQEWVNSTMLEDLLTGERQITKLPKPILDDVEKEYLSNVIKPFRDKVISIVKCGDYDCDNYSFIRIIVKQKGNLDWINLPIFKKGIMYKCMELDKDYTLEELGL